MTDCGAAKEPVLPAHAMEVVTALAAAPVPETEVLTDVSAEMMDKAESDRASKWARRKEKMLCYRCGDKGHFIAECVARLCDTCGKLAHESGECSLLRDQAPSLKMYGVYCAELTFFESPTEHEVADESPSKTTGIVKVTRGEVSEAQIVQRLRELAPGDFQWDLVGLADKMFRVECPSVEDLQRLLSFGMCKVPGTDGILEFQEWKLVEPQGIPLTQAWLRFSGAPSSPLQDARVVASLGILVGKPERVDMTFTRAQGIARVLVSILNVEYVPEVVKWAYRGRIYNLVIEFEDESLLYAPAHGSDVDMHEGDGGAGVQEPPAEDSGRQLSMGPGSDTVTTGDGAAQPSSVPSKSLRFGSFEPFSAPPRLWSDRVESEEAFELALPALDFLDAVDSGSGDLRVSSLVVRGAEEVSRQVATPSSGQRVPPPQEMPQLTGPPMQGGDIGQAVSGSFCAEGRDAGQVSPVSSVLLGGGLGQEDSDASSPVVSPSRMVPVSPSGVGSGQAASELSPMVVPSPVQVGEPGRAVLAMSPPPSAMASSGGARQASLPFGFTVGRPMQGARTAGWGEAGGRTPSAISREEVIAFGGIQDPLSKGRRVSDRLQAHPDVDDIQQRCAMRAAKLREVEVSTDLEAERALEMIRDIAAVKPMCDSEVHALGVRALEIFCADLLPSSSEAGVEEVSTEIGLASPSDTGYEDQLQNQAIPKRNWKRKPELKPDFLADLVRMCGSEQLSYLVGGDFNIIRRREDKNNDNFDGRWSFMFNTIIESLNLREIELSGRKFTWANALPNPTYEKLDRVLASVDWEQKFPLNKIRHLRSVLRGWAKHLSGIYKVEKERLLSLIQSLDVKAETTLLPVAELQTKLDAELRLKELLREEELKWALRAKVWRVVQGDANTEFFHMIANGKHRKKRIFQLEQDEGTIVGQENLKLYITEFYKQLFGPPANTCVSLDESRVEDVPQLTVVENEVLTAPFTEKEVFEAVSQMETNKAPGPDGFPAEFYKKCWCIIKGDLLPSFNDLFAGQLHLFQLNFGTITLLPKKTEAVRIEQFRPICLLNVSFKIFTKVGTNRLSQIAHVVVHPTQTAFMPDRNILEGVVVLHETLHEIHTKKLDGTHKGLRQGDPMSPILFNIVVDMLAILIGRAKNAGQILRNKYLQSKTLSQVTMRPTDSPFWKGLMRVKSTFFNRTKFIVGDGNDTRFWEDTWLGETPLALQYPSLYRIVNHRDALVAMIMQATPLNIQFRRVLVGNR
ncbi:uncharacterized protein [Aegilops tauschii subsp. strangulata]|uniref:uncharacterized protein n=1 Tax=Aegilops tauschii subsp. strangulata TaxID=200361 RepID=UPI003CC85A0F